MPKFILMAAGALAIFTRLQAQPYNPAIDVRQYDFHLQLNDSNNIIRGTAVITLQFRENTPEFTLDLTKKNDEGKGMTVTVVDEDKKPIPFTQNSQHLILHTSGTPGSQHTYTISYEGIPADGL